MLFIYIFCQDLNVILIKIYIHKHSIAIFEMYQNND